MPARVGDPVFVLIHSPLVGPTSWLPVARELELRGRVAVVPSLLGVAEAPEPQWRHVPAAVRVATSHLQRRVVLVGHSGAGLLLPVIADALDVEVAGLVFVGSRLPPPAGRSPLSAPEFMDQLRAMATDGLLPTWSRWFGLDAMRELVPDERLRTDLEAEMPRLPLSYFEAAVPLPDEWGARPCAYLRFSDEPYAESAAQAREQGWAVAEMPGAGHDGERPDRRHRRAARPRTRAQRIGQEHLTSARRERSVVRLGGRDRIQARLSHISTAARRGPLPGD